VQPQAAEGSGLLTDRCGQQRLQSSLAPTGLDKKNGRCIDVEGLRRDIPSHAGSHEGKGPPARGSIRDGPLPRARPPLKSKEPSLQDRTSHRAAAASVRAAASSRSD